MEKLNYNEIINSGDSYRKYMSAAKDLKEKTWIRFSIIYSGYHAIESDLEDFEICWSLLETDEERQDFCYNLCYTGSAEKKNIEIYFHCYDYKDNHWHDYSLSSYRRIMKNRPGDIELWDSIGY